MLKKMLLNLRIHTYIIIIWWSPFIPSRNLDEVFTYNQSWAVSPIQYLLRQKISIVDTFVFVFVYIIQIIKVFVIVSISHK